MNVNLPLRIIILYAVVIVVSVAAFVALVVAGYGEAAAGLPLFLGAVIPLVIGQSRIAGQLADHTERVDTALNGGLSHAVRQVVTEQLTRMAAGDETHGTTTVADAAQHVLGSPVTPVETVDAPIPPVSATGVDGATGVTPPQPAGWKNTE